MIHRTLAPPSDLDGANARIPGFVVGGAFAIIGVLLTLVDYGPTGWLAIGIPLSVGAAWSSQYLLGWFLIAFLAAGQLARQPSLSIQFLVLLAGLHLLYVLATLALGLPWRAWVQPAVFARPLVRFVAIEVPVQLLAVIALLLLAPGHHGHRPVTAGALAVVGVLALAGLALLLLSPRLARSPTTSAR